MTDSHGNKVCPCAYHKDKPTRLVKVPASSVPYGESISRNGRTVWIAYAGEQLVAVAPTSDEALIKYRAWVRQQWLEWIKK
jgi:hypothetical protein